MEKTHITILTPTFNRAMTLPRLAASLETQAGAQFEWLVVDDGSTDGTDRVLDQLEAEGRLPLRRLRLENGGKHRAINAAVAIARGGWTFIVDSDDALPVGALERITRAIDEVEGDPTIGGIMGLRSDFRGNIIGQRLPRAVRRASATDITYRMGIRGDKAEVYRTELLRRFSFPVFPGEKFITECVVWYRIASAGYMLRLIDEPIYLCEYLPDGLSSNSLRLRACNPRGTLLFYREALGLDYPPHRLYREAINFCRFAVAVGHRTLLLELQSLDGRALMIALAALPAGLIAAALDRHKLGARE